MPLSNYDPWFGSKKGSAARAHQELIKQYGLKKGNQVFYSLLADRKKAKRTFKRRSRD